MLNNIKDYNFTDSSTQYHFVVNHICTIYTHYIKVCMHSIIVPLIIHDWPLYSFIIINLPSTDSPLGLKYVYSFAKSSLILPFNIPQSTYSRYLSTFCFSSSTFLSLNVLFFFYSSSPFSSYFNPFPILFILAFRSPPVVILFPISFLPICFLMLSIFGWICPLFLHATPCIFALNFTTPFFCFTVSLIKFYYLLSCFLHPQFLSSLSILDRETNRNTLLLFSVLSMCIPWWLSFLSFVIPFSLVTFSLGSLPKFLVSSPCPNVSLFLTWSCPVRFFTFPSLLLHSTLSTSSFSFFYYFHSLSLSFSFPIFLGLYLFRSLSFLVSIFLFPVSSSLNFYCFHLFVYVVVSFPPISSFLFFIMFIFCSNFSILVLAVFLFFPSPVTRSTSDSTPIFSSISPLYFSYSPFVVAYFSA